MIAVPEPPRLTRRVVGVTAIAEIPRACGRLPRQAWSIREALPPLSDLQPFLPLQPVSLPSHDRRYPKARSDGGAGNRSSQSSCSAAAPNGSTHLASFETR
ncbi:uncharacterized protein PV07_06258 [Cladophialophora immunda]|uniref:Uncharacterized protein n=1 Tax=Cladophialophora immunda TaxID=569365 RepID=A0A0D2D4D5_9EURO|nr:uncharacterized protein PV07_06258 [Cladophialophora immunda]KIW30519.1 hypothetical protein PV07_06258 [Cladophialophora immunda]